MVTLNVELTDDQYARYMAGFKKLQRMEDDPSEAQLIAQLKREASAITYAAEVGAGDSTGWSF